MNHGPRVALMASSLLFWATAWSFAVPPTDPKDLALYNHCQEWLKNFPASYVATNIRGQGKQYAVRRLAALDMLRQRRDFGTVYELMVELNNKSFLSEPIMDVLDEWKAKRAIPLLDVVAADRSRPKAVREKARQVRRSLAASAAPAGPPTFH